MRLAGLDLGTKTIGIALSDLRLKIATPFRTIRRTKFSIDAKELLALCEREKVGGLILGLPLNMNGTEGPRAQATRAFVRNLAPLTGLPIVLWDERLSTVAAERAMIEADLSQEEACGENRCGGGRLYPAGRSRPPGKARLPSRASGVGVSEGQDGRSHLTSRSLRGPQKSPKSKSPPPKSPASAIWVSGVSVPGSENRPAFSEPLAVA